VRELRILPGPGPVQAFTFVNLVSTVGTGLWLTGSALFFTRGLGISVTRVGFGLSVATAVGLCLMVPLGRLADQVGARPVYSALLLVEALATATYLVVRSYPAFLATATVAAVADRGVNGVVGAFIHNITAGTERARTRAYLRSVTNIGVALGTALAAAALQIDTLAAHSTLVFATAILFAGAGLLLLRVPVNPQPIRRPAPTKDAPTKRRSGRSRRTAFHDPAYLPVVLTNGLLALHFEILGFAVPLWVATRTEAPRWMVSVVLVVNTVLVVLLQVRTSKRVGTVLAAAHAVRRAGLLLAFSCLILGTVSYLPVALAAVSLVAFAVVYTAGELWHASAEFFLSFDLAPDNAQGDYQAVFALGRGLARAAAPTLFALVVLRSGMSGWAATAVVLLGASVATASAARRASRLHASAAGDERTSHLSAANDPGVRQ